MLEQVQNLDLLYEKETTTKLLEFKLKYLVSYSQLMRNYFLNMVFTDIVAELTRIDTENPDLENLGSKLIVITCMIVNPQEMGLVESPNDLTGDHLDKAKRLMLTTEFSDQFKNICQIDVIPDLDISQIKHLKTNFIDVLLTNNREQVDRLENAGRLLNSWVDGMLEYVILKHEVVVLRMKNKKVLEKIQTVSQLWPKKKEFIEGAYKILLFSKGERKFASAALPVMREFKELSVLRLEYFDYPIAFKKVMKNWYQKRIQEETLKNQKLQELHDNLLQIKALRDKQAQMNIGSQGHQKEEKSEQEMMEKHVNMQMEITRLRTQIRDAQGKIEETKQTIDA